MRHRLLLIVYFHVGARSGSAFYGFPQDGCEQCQAKEEVAKQGQRDVLMYVDVLCLGRKMGHVTGTPCSFPTKNEQNR